LTLINYGPVAVPVSPETPKNREETSGPGNFTRRWWGL